VKYLLDTHVILWSAIEPERLSSSVVSLLQNEENELWFSPISIWEILVLAEKGRIQIKATPESFVRNIIEHLPLKEAMLNSEIAIESRKVKLHHQDPADRFLAATAIIYGLTMITADKRLIDSGQFPVLKAF